LHDYLYNNNGQNKNDCNQKDGSIRGAEMKMQRRSMQDRRTGKERRRLLNIKKYFFNTQDRRASSERRNEAERRSGWIRLSKWSSVYLPKLKIAKFLSISK
jgi:hypothetical protein